MTNRFDAARLQPMLIAIALVATVIAALALFFSAATRPAGRTARAGSGAGVAVAEHTAASGRGCAGIAPAFDALAESRSRLEQVLASPGAQALGGESGWPVLLEQAQAVLDGRAAALDAQRRRRPSVNSRPSWLPPPRASRRRPARPASMVWSRISSASNCVRRPWSRTHGHGRRHGAG